MYVLVAAYRHICAFLCSDTLAMEAVEDHGPQLVFVAISYPMLQEFRRMMADSFGKNEERKEARLAHSRTGSDVSVDHLEVNNSSASASSAAGAAPTTTAATPATATTSSKSFTSASAPVRAPAPVPSQPQTTSSSNMQHQLQPASPMKGVSSPKAVR